MQKYYHLIESIKQLTAEVSCVVFTQEQRRSNLRGVER